MAADHFCLIWNNFQNSILSALGNLQSSQDLVDVTLMCEGKNVRAHKVILSACSPYFRNLFKETPCQHPVIILKDVSHYDLTALLQFMYQGEVMVTQDCLASFLKTAELLQISGLAGTTPSTSVSNEASDHPPRPPDLPINPPDSPNTVINKLNANLSLTKHKRTEIKEKEPEKTQFDTDPQQSCSYQQTANVMIKTEAMDRDYEEMLTDTGELKDLQEEQFDNTSSHSEEPSILERSLKAQTGPHVTKYKDIEPQNNMEKRKISETLPVNKKVKNISDKEYDSESTSHGWNLSQDGLCPHCNKMYSNQSALKYHVRLVHSDMLHMFCCHLCPESFKFREHYKIHMWEQHNVRS